MSPVSDPPFSFSKLCFDVRPDSLDFRDKMYVPTLVEVPTRIELDEYREYEVPVLNQGTEGACTGFGLATVANYLLRRRKYYPENVTASPRMAYEMAKRYDDWPGEGYSGSSARGAMKGWHKHGLCSIDAWPYDASKVDRVLSNERAVEARKRPLGAYFRVNHKDLVGMHSALAEVGVLYVSAQVHEGWRSVKTNGSIPYKRGNKVIGGHAFAIVAFDESGFWLQNSWGPSWGFKGFAHLTYDDWLANASDVWVARLGVPVVLGDQESTVTNTSPGARQSQSYSYSELRPHIISVCNDGSLSCEGTFATSEQDVREIFENDIPRITKGWEKKRILLYAHGGLVPESSFIQRVAEYRAVLLNAQVYPIAFTWRTGFWDTLTNILQDALRQRKPEGFLENTLGFMLDRLDDTLEPLVRNLGGKLLWDEMKENARRSTIDPEGGARITLKYLVDMVIREPNTEIHLAGHSAGSIYLGLLTRLLTERGKITSGPLKGESGMGAQVASCTLWAPGITIDEFKETYLPAIKKGQLDRFALYTLTEDAEKDDSCANLYHKSLLYMVANAFEPKRFTPLLGLEKYVKADRVLGELFKSDKAEWILTPNDAPDDSRWASQARAHGEFDDDGRTLKSTLQRILASKTVQADFQFSQTAASVNDRVEMIREV